MIDKAIYEHLLSDRELSGLLTSYGGKPAVFNQEAPPDTDALWAGGPQYGRIVFALDFQGDPGRAIGGSLSVDVQCQNGRLFPEELEPVVRKLIDGCFYSDSGCTMAAQWVDSRYFTEPTMQVSGVTLTFSLLAFPLLSTVSANVTERINEWTSGAFPELLVINRDALPGIWKPEPGKAAVYWRVVSLKPAGWIPDTYQTIWRTATLKCHVFSTDICEAGEISQKLVNSLYGIRRLVQTGESQIIVGRSNSVDAGADALRSGQVTVEATFGEIVNYVKKIPMNHINYDQEG